MRCLHCGNTLSALKKLTDSGFCSTDHRDLFYAEQQRLILERLRLSAARFQRLRRGGAAPESVRPAARFVPPVEQLEAPAALAAFLYAKPENSDRPSPLRSFGILGQFIPAFPAAGIRASVRTGLPGRVLSDFPWPRYNAGLKAILEPLVAEDASTVDFGRRLQVNGFVSSNIVRSALLPPRQLDAASMALARPFILRMARPKPALALGPLRVGVDRRAFHLVLMEYCPPVELTPIESPPGQFDIQAARIESSATSPVANGLRLRTAVPAHSIAFLDRVYRMRPKSGSPSSEAPGMIQTALQSVSSHTAPAMPKSGLGSSSYQLGRSIRFIRSRPRGPVPGETPFQISSELNLEGSTGNPAWPSLVAANSSPSLESVTTVGTETALELASRSRDMAAAPPAPEALYSAPSIRQLAWPELALEPAQARQPFRMRPPSGVASPEITGLIPPTQAEALQSRPASPALTQLSAPAPAFVTRMFRMRPKAGVDTGSSVITSPALNSVAYAGDPASPEFPLTRADAAPPVQQRFFRVRPRSEACPNNAKQYESPAPSPLDVRLEPAFVEPAAPFAGNFAPPLVDRPYRGRPRFAVPDQCSLVEISSIENELFRVGAAVPCIAAETDDLAPVIHERFFRVRPRSGVGAESKKAYERLNVYSLNVSLDAAICGVCAGEAGAFAPARINSFLRWVPETGITSGFAPYASASLSPEPLLPAPAVRSLGLGQCEPSSAQRLFKFRPKTGVNAETTAHISAVEPLDFPASGPEPVPDWWDVLTGPKPIFMNRMYRMRFKQPAQDPATLSQEIRAKHLPVADPEPVLATLPTPEAEAAPSFLHRLYRMRPRAGKTLAPASNAIPCNAIEPRPTSGAPASALQSISKHWRSTPLSVKSIAATVPILLLLMLFPFDVPTMAAADGAVRQAIVKRAAVEHSDDFVGGLEHWRGVEKWKRFPSGAVQPVGLGLFTPSLDMRNYLVEFSAQIQKGGVGFVVRAADEKNYQAIKLVTLKAGPLPTVAVQRYAVLNGKEVNRQQLILPMTVSADTLYRVSLDVNDESFTLMVQGRVVDFWSEEQLKTGGAGFFGAKGEKALIQNIRMSHQTDTIGKLFAALAL